MSILPVVQGKNLKIPVCHQTHNRLGEKTKAEACDGLGMATFAFRSAGH
jgi:hypothetical protein